MNERERRLDKIDSAMADRRWRRILGAISTAVTLKSSRIAELPAAQLKENVQIIGVTLRRARTHFELLRDLDKYSKQYPDVIDRFPIFIGETAAAMWRETIMSLALITEKRSSRPKWIRHFFAAWFRPSNSSIRIGFPWLVRYAEVHTEQFRYINTLPGNRIADIRREFERLQSSLKKIRRMRNEWLSHIDKQAYKSPIEFCLKVNLQPQRLEETINGLCLIFNLLGESLGVGRIPTTDASVSSGEVKRLFVELSQTKVFEENVQTN
jgi:hypothetical protein